MKFTRLRPITTTVCLGGALLTTAPLAHAQADSMKMEKLEKDNAELRKRLDALESMAQKDGTLPSGKAVPKFVSAMSDMTLSGFVTASYFYDTSKPPGHTSPGYLWNRKSDSFSLNKVKLTIANAPAERSGDKFSAAYRVSLIYGEDAPIVNSGSSTTGFESLREAYVELNVPVGTGLNVKAGELISLLNYESGDGGAVNDNFSQGYQWFYTGNGPAAGLQLGYTFTDWFDLKVRVQNGLYAGPIDNNGSKTFVASLNFKPSPQLWFNLIGWTGREDAAFTQFVDGGSLIGGYKVTDQFSIGTELDYFSFKNSTGSHPVWSTGGWFSYAFTPKFGAAIRAEFLSDEDGVDASGDPLGFPSNSGQDLTSIAFTLNYKPLPNVKIQPEVRYDHTTLANGFGTQRDRVILGVGVSYLF